MLGFRRSRSGTESPTPQTVARQVGCLGKLPVQPEYIKHNVAHREVRALDQWLQHGVGLAARSGGHGGAEPGNWIYHGVLAATDDERPILFSMRPSRDQSGRHYPFVIFELPGARERDASAGMLPLCSGAFYSGAESVMAQPWNREPLSTVQAWVDAIGEAPRVPARAGLGDLGAQRLIEQLYPDTDPERRVPHLRRTVECLRQVERRTAPRVHWGLRLPLAASEPAIAISWWVRLAESVLGRGSWRPCYLWRAADPELEQSGELLLFFRMPPAQVVTWILQHRGLHGTAVDPFDEIGDSERDVLPEVGVSTTHSLIEWLTGGVPR